MRQRWGVQGLARLGLVGAVLLGAAACDLVPPVTLVVNTDVDDADAVPGDGVCEITAGVGDCSIRAAIEEGNALGAAAITVPAGNYYPGGPPMVVTGDLSINKGAPQQVQVAVGFTVAEDASLWMEGVRGVSGIPLFQIFVHGTLVAKGSAISALGGPAVVVGPTGAAVFQNSSLAGLIITGSGAAVVNEGQLVLRHTAVLGVPSAVETTGAGATAVVGSVLQTWGTTPGPVCTGSLPSSDGYNIASDTTCGLSGVGDLEGADPLISTSFENEGDPLVFSVAPGSPAIDAIPTGVGGCGVDLVDDIGGAPRPTDGNGDSIAACDIGPVERPAG